MKTLPFVGVLAVAAGIAFVSHPALAHDITFGSEGTSNAGCTSYSIDWQTIRAAALGIFPHAHGCVLTGSLDAANPSGNSSIETYHFTVSMDNVNPVLDNSAARTVELRDQAGVNDPDTWPVATTSHVVAGANIGHTFRLQCRKGAAESDNLTVSDSSLTVVCIQQ